MQISIEDRVLEKYPQTEIGYLVAKVQVKKKEPFIDQIKKTLLEKLQEKGINAANFSMHQGIFSWRKIYQEDFQVKAKKHLSSVEALLKRVIAGKKMWDICNIVDLYNCCSVLSLLPMGGYDLEKIKGDIQIRYAREKETFLALGAKEEIEVKTNHIIYADQKKVLCWLWNHKDAAQTCIDENTKDVVFFIDSALPVDVHAVKNALNLLADMLQKCEGILVDSGILNRNMATVNI